MRSWNLSPGIINKDSLFLWYISLKQEPAKSIMAFDRIVRMYRSCLFQIVIVGLVAFCEPGIWTALNNLGAGGNAKVRLLSVRALRDHF
jgi:hypothetical protein